MTTKIINNFNSLNSKDLATIKGGACSFWGATAAVGVGAVGGAIKGGITYGLTCGY